MVGSENQVAWAERIRARVMAEAEAEAAPLIARDPAAEPQFRAQVAQLAAVESARTWIELESDIPAEYRLRGLAALRQVARRAGMVRS